MLSHWRGRDFHHVDAHVEYNGGGDHGRHTCLYDPLRGRSFASNHPHTLLCWPHINVRCECTARRGAVIKVAGRAVANRTTTHSYHQPHSVVSNAMSVGHVELSRISTAKSSPQQNVLVEAEVLPTQIAHPIQVSGVISKRTKMPDTSVQQPREFSAPLAQQAVSQPACCVVCGRACPSSSGAKTIKKSGTFDRSTEDKNDDAAGSLSDDSNSVAPLRDSSVWIYSMEARSRPRPRRQMARRQTSA